MWQMKREIIPVVVGALEVINKGSEELVREIPGNINNNNNTIVVVVVVVVVI